MDNWQTTCIDTALYRLAEATSTRLVEDFFMTMYTKKPNFTLTYMVQLKQDIKFELADLIKNFCIFICIQKALKSTDSNSAFAIKKEDLKTLSFKGQFYDQLQS